MGTRLAERGQSMAMALLLCLMVVGATAFAVDLGYAMMERSNQMIVLQESVSKCMLPSTAVIVKNSATPGQDMCEELVGFIRDTGFDGEIEAYYYEPTRAESGLPDNRRLYVFGATIKSQTPTIFASIMGLNVPETATRRWANVQPYAAESTYTPTSVQSGVYRVSVGQNSGTWTPVVSADETAMPGVGDEIAYAMAKTPGSRWE